MDKIYVSDNWNNWNKPDGSFDEYSKAMCEGKWPELKVVINEALTKLKEQYIDKYNGIPATFNIKDIQSQYNHLETIQRLEWFLANGDGESQNHTCYNCQKTKKLKL
jgi:hypothetical protein